MQNKDLLMSKNIYPQQITQHYPPQNNNRAKTNWSRIRQLLMKRGKQVKKQPNEYNSTSHCLQQKVQSLYLSSTNKKESYAGKQQQNKVLLKSRKNNMYSLFDQKSAEITTSILQKRLIMSSDHLNQKQNTSLKPESYFEEQNLIQTSYSIGIDIKNSDSNFPQIKQLRFKTLTPLPTIHKILQATGSGRNQLYKGQSQIDTTGFWVWQAQQILSYFLIRDYQKFMNQRLADASNGVCPQKPLKQANQLGQNHHINYFKLNKVLELGAGSSGLASIVLTRLLQDLKSLQNANTHLTSQLNTQIVTELMVTDGKIQNIDYLRKNIQINQNSFQFTQQSCNILHKYNSGHLSQGVFITNTHARFMLWGTQIYDKFDLVLSADSLFFQQFHKQLLATLQNSMGQKSVALFVNPKRGKSMGNFIQLAKQNNFTVDTIDFKDKTFKNQEERVKSSNQFDQDRHIFYFLILKRINKRDQILRE